MKYTKYILAIVVTTFLFFSCEKNTSDIENEENTVSNFSENLNTEDVTNMIESLSILYPITIINEDETKEIISSDEELNKLREKKSSIEFPIEITINRETVNIDSTKTLREILKKRAHKKPPFKLIFPVTVINLDEITLIIEDKEAMKAYMETLEKGTKPTFQYPISIEQKDGTTVIIESEDALKTHIQKQSQRKKQHVKKSPFKLVFPVTVINLDETTLIIENKEAMKTYIETLEKGIRPVFQYPITVEQKDDTTVTIESENTLKEHIKANRPRKK